MKRLIKKMILHFTIAYIGVFLLLLIDQHIGEEKVRRRLKKESLGEWVFSSTTINTKNAPLDD